MALTRLHNEDWGYETNCFVCEPTNSDGLQIPFFHDQGANQVIADFALPQAFSGAPNMLHGGVTLAILDEAMAWACIAIGHRWAVTTETTTKFERALLVDKPYKVIARVTDQTETLITTAAEVVFVPGDGNPRTCAAATAAFTILGEAQVQRIVGAEATTPIDSTYTRPDGV